MTVFLFNFTLDDIIFFQTTLSAGQHSARLLMRAGIFFFVFLKVYNGQFKAIEK